MRSLTGPYQAQKPNTPVGVVIRRRPVVRSGLRIFGPMDATGGYGQFTSDIVLGLKGLGVDVHAWPSQPERELCGGVREIISNGGASDLLVYPPDQLSAIVRQGVPFALFTMWESSRLRPEWVSEVNRARVVIVPNEWNASCFSAQGVTPPIRVVGLGCNPGTFRLAQARDWSAPFHVGIAGRWASGGERKGLQEAVDAFLTAFPSPAGEELHVKCSRECVVDGRGDSRVRINRESLTMDGMADWYRSMSVFLSMARAEGWGLHQQQAMMCGVPLISPRFGGVAEFFGPGDGWVVRHKLTPSTGFYEGLGLWCEPDKNSAVWALRDARDQWRLDPGAPGSPWSRCWSGIRQFSTDRMCRKTLEVLQEFSLA